MNVNATTAFVTFAQSAAEECARGTNAMLFLSYTKVETQNQKGLKWVLNVVQRSDFRGTPTMIVNGWKIFYQPEMMQELTDSTLDFRNGQIIVLARER
jgi:hypothetical protein